MKKLLFLFSFIFYTLHLLLIPNTAHASEPWVIDNFQSNINVLQTGKVEITETIDVDFGSVPKHGIYRDIPYIYTSENNTKLYSEIDPISVLQNSNPVPYQTSKNGNYFVFKIGDPNIMLSGKSQYQIKYQISGILKSFADHDELYYDVTGNGWPVPIKMVNATITLPQNGITQVACYQGIFGSTEKCISRIVSPIQAKFITNRVLQENEGLSAVVGYGKGLVPILTIAPPVEVNYSTSESSIYAPNFLVTGITFLLGISLVYFIWRKKGKDLSTNVSLATIVVQYSAPDKLRPAEIGTIIDERADTLDVSATIVDLAVRGYLTITEEPKKWLFGSVDYTLLQKDKDTSSLNEYEDMLLDRIFADGDVIKISELKMQFYQDLMDVKKALYKDVVDKKYFANNPESIRKDYTIVGVLLFFFGIFLGFFGLFESTGITSGVGDALIIISIFVIVVSRSMSRRTITGHQIYLQILGFKLFIDKVEKFRQQFFEKKNIFNEILPYAMIFGDVEKLALAMKDMGIKPTQPNWYYSSRPFDPIIFSSNINNFSSSLTSAIASQPSSNGFASSGSGFSSGGGFSGGGSGGGGGGSW